jgi:hypothetical protein
LPSALGGRRCNTARPTCVKCVGVSRTWSRLGLLVFGKFAIRWVEERAPRVFVNVPARSGRHPPVFDLSRGKIVEVWPVGPSSLDGWTIFGQSGKVTVEVGAAVFRDPVGEGSISEVSVEEHSGYFEGWLRDQDGSSDVRGTRGNTKSDRSVVNSSRFQRF